MDNIRTILKNCSFLLNLYQKDELIHIKHIYIAHLKHKRIIENEFDFIKFVEKLHEMGYLPRKYSIIRYDIKKPFDENNIYLKPANDYQKRLDTLATEIKNSKTRVKIKLIKPQTTTDYLIRYYPETILKMLRNNYGTKKRTHLIENGFSFEKYVKKAYELGYSPYSHQIRRLDTTKPFSPDNIFLKKADGLITKLKKMSQIIEKNERPKIKIKINDDNPFQICLKHPNRKYERRIYIKP